MILKSLRNIFTLVAFCLFISIVNVYSQSDSTVIKNDDKNDSASIASKLELVRKLGESAIQVVIFENAEKQIHSRQFALLDELNEELNKVNERFNRGIDTSSINQEIKNIENLFRIASEGTYKGDIEVNSIRNLNASSLLIREIAISLKLNKEKAENLLNDLKPLKANIDSLQSDTILLKFSSDTTLFNSYFQKLVTVMTKLTPIDSSLSSTIRNVNDEINYMKTLEGNMNTRLNLIEENRETVTGNLFSGGSTNLFDKEESKESVYDKINFSYIKAKLVLKYYLKNHTGRILLLFIVFSFLVYFIFNVRKHNYPDRFSELPEKAKLVFNHPVISAALISLTLLQFIFTDPPVIFQGIIWAFSSAILTVILWNYFSGLQRVYWLYLIAAFIAVFLSDLMLKESDIEKWFMLFIAISGIAVAIFASRKNVADIKNNRTKFIFFILTLSLLTVSVFANLTGRNNLSKISLVICFFALLTAFLLYWTMILIIELINVSAETYKSEGNHNFQHRLQKFKLRIPLYLKFVLFLGWIILVAHNFYFYQKYNTMFFSYIEEETVIGDFSFSLEKLFLFIFIIFLSAIISKTISFYSDKIDDSGKGNLRDSSNSGGLGNWMLLIRIGVISLGTLLAFAATGFPIDKLTIIIGSLGVGIGLGLQSIVNNLVSGIMLAIEKPFKIGDYIEVGGEAGRIKEIGIRSSKLSTSEGADIIIPNGDLLSKHVINWTLRNSQKRSELILKINYGGKLNEIRNIFQDILDNNENIEKNPSPEVLMHTYSGNSAEYRLLYWTYIDQEDQVRSELIVAVEDDLKKAGVEFTPEKK